MPEKIYGGGVGMVGRRAKEQREKLKWTAPKTNKQKRNSKGNLKSGVAVVIRHRRGDIKTHTHTQGFY